MKFRKVFAIALALTKSQLRASRNTLGNFNILRRPIILLMIDAVVFLLAMVGGYVIVAFVSVMGGSAHTQALQYVVEAMVLVPAVIPGTVLVAGIFFELNVSSKFSASDTVNWLPIEQMEYVMASALSISYDYSATAALALGLTVIPAVALGLMWVWTTMALFTFIGLFMGGVLVEMVRAAVNRVSSAVMARARRGALVLRLALSVAIIIVFEAVFNPNLILVRIPAFSSGPSALWAVPLFWASVAVEGISNGQAAYVLIFSAGSVGFTAFLLLLAVRIRSRYWSPTPTAVRITTADYRPQASFLSRLGLTSPEVAIVRKDSKSTFRRREILNFLTVPVVLVVLFSLDLFLTPGISSGSGGPMFLADLPIVFVAGIFGLMISSISFGQESKAVMVLYSLPISPEDILRAKAFFALALAASATAATAVYFAVLTGANATTFIENLVIGLSVAVEEVAVGLAFGVTHPDFQERPRPRFVDPMWQLVMVLGVGLPLLGVTSIPIFARDALATVPGATFPTIYLFPVAVAFAAAMAALFYRWAARSVVGLMSEYRV